MRAPGAAGEEIGVLQVRALQFARLIHSGAKYSVALPLERIAGPSLIQNHPINTQQMLMVHLSPFSNQGMGDPMFQLGVRVSILNGPV